MLRLSLPIVYHNGIGKISSLVMGVYIVHIPVLRVMNHFVKAHDFVSAVIIYIMVLSVSFVTVKFMWRFDYSRVLVKL